MTIFDWVISTLDCAPSEDGKTDVVKVAHWRCSGVDGDFSGSVYSTCALPAPTQDAPFTPYADLTKDEVLGWIWSNGVDKDTTEGAVQKQIDTAKNPPIVPLPAPWNV